MALYMTACVHLTYGTVHDGLCTVTIWHCKWPPLYSYNIALYKTTSVQLQYCTVHYDLCTVTVWHCTWRPLYSYNMALRSVSDVYCRGIVTYIVSNNPTPEITLFIMWCGRTQNAVFRFHCNNGYASALLPYLQTTVEFLQFLSITV